MARSGCSPLHGVNPNLKIKNNKLKIIQPVIYNAGLITLTIYAET